MYYDLKGKERFPPEPSQEVVEPRFQACLKEIKVSPAQTQIMNALNNKYKHRFVVKHTERMLNITQTKMRKDRENRAPEKHGIHKEIEDRLTKIEESPSTFKTLLHDLEKFLSDKDAHKVFLDIKGVERLVGLLSREEKKNREGTLNNFTNQI